jgi:hypothetical protein
MIVGSDTKKSQKKIKLKADKMIGDIMNFRLMRSRCVKNPPSSPIRKLHPTIPAQEKSRK